MQRYCEALTLYIAFCLMTLSNCYDDTTGRTLPIRWRLPTICFASGGFSLTARRTCHRNRKHWVKKDSSSGTCTTSDLSVLLAFILLIVIVKIVSYIYDDTMIRLPTNCRKKLFRSFIFRRVFCRGNALFTPFSTIT